MTGLGVILDQRVNATARTGVCIFRAHGQLYHRLDHLVPGSHRPRHMQLYIYDTDEASEHRVKRSPDIDINLIRKILRISENNPYVQLITCQIFIFLIILYTTIFFEPSSSISFLMLYFYGYPEVLIIDLLLEEDNGGNTMQEENTIPIVLRLAFSQQDQQPAPTCSSTSQDSKTSARIGYKRVFSFL